MVGDETTHNDDRRTINQNIWQNLRIDPACHRHLSPLQSGLNELNFSQRIHAVVLEVEGGMDTAVIWSNCIDLINTPPNITDRYQVYHYLLIEGTGLVHSATNRNVMRHTKHGHNIGTRFKPDACLNITGIHDFEIGEHFKLRIGILDLRNNPYPLFHKQRGANLDNIHEITDLLKNAFGFLTIA